MTPGRLAIWGLALGGVWLVLFGIGAAANEGWIMVGLLAKLIAPFILVPSVLLLAAAAVAKVIQIGVRSAND